MADDQGSPASRRERPAGTGGQEDGSRAAAEAGRAGEADAAGGADTAGEPGPLLADLARLRRQTRAARHAYWFPLVLFGLLTCGAAPLYVAPRRRRHSGAYAFDSGPILLSGTPFGTSTFYIGWYWAVALVGGYLLTLLWYRRHARPGGRGDPRPRLPDYRRGADGAVLVIPPLTRWCPAVAGSGCRSGTCGSGARSRS